MTTKQLFIRISARDIIFIGCFFLSPRSNGAEKCRLPVAAGGRHFLFRESSEAVIVNDTLILKSGQRGLQSLNVSFPDSFLAVLHPVESASCNPGLLFQGSKG